MTILAFNGQNHEVTAFICDTVRTESDGKTSLVGITAGKVQAVAFPVQIQLGVYAQIKPNPPSGTAIALEIRLDDTVLFAFPPSQIPAEPAEHSDDSAIQIAADRLMLTIPAPGRLGLYLGFADAPLERVTSVNYVAMPDSQDAATT